MAKIPTYEEIAKKVAEKALDEFLYEGKSIREWIKIIASEDAISRKAVMIELNEAQIEGTEEYKGLGEAKQIVYDAPTIIKADAEE